MSFRPVLAVAILAASFGCAHRARATAASVSGTRTVAFGDTVPDDSIAEYFGWYRWGFEHSEFVACGTGSNDRPWWVIPTVVAMRQRDSLAADVMPGGTGPVFVRVRGIAGKRVPTGAGHLGGSARYFRLLEVLDMRKAEGATCPVRT
jgi:hypothetical protein